MSGKALLKGRSRGGGRGVRPGRGAWKGGLFGEPALRRAHDLLDRLSHVDLLAAVPILEKYALPNGSAAPAAAEEPAFVSPGPPPPKLDPCEVEFELRTRGGSRLVRTNGGDICPADWSDAFMVYPPGSLMVSDHPLEFMSDEQWELAERMLSEGFVLGINASEVEVPDAVCAVASHCPFPLTAVREPEGNDVVFVARRDIPAVKGKRK